MTPPTAPPTFDAATVKQFFRENFQPENLETTVLNFLELHFPLTMSDHPSQTVVRFVSAVLRFASQHTDNVQAQAFIGGLYGMLNLYGVKGTVAIIMKIQGMTKKGKA